MNQGPQKPKSCFDLYDEEAEYRNLEAAMMHARNNLFKHIKRMKLRERPEPLPLP